MSELRIAIRFRVALMFILTFGLAICCAVEVVSSLQSGVSDLPLGRRGPVFRFVRGESPFGFYAGVCLFAAASVLLALASILQMKAILRPDATRNRQFVQVQIASLERSAPSGLRPLWIGLAVFAGCFVLYATFV